MQGLTAVPREHLSSDAVRRLLTGPQVLVSAGLELLDDANRLVEDISDDLVGGSVSWDNRDAIHGSCRLDITRELRWGHDRVRPYMVLDDGATQARFYLGVFILTTPDDQRGEDPKTYSVTGYDLLNLLATSGPADTWEVTAGTTYLSAVRDVVAASGAGFSVLIDGTLQDTALPATRVWAVTSPAPSWLRIVTDLLAEIGYTPPWCDEQGQLRSRPFIFPDARAVEWTLDTSDEGTDLVDPNRKVSTETGDVANWWRFVRTGMDTTPVEGDGIYTPPVNQSQGPNSIDALGREVRKFERVQAADQATLVAQGDQIRAADIASVTTYDLSIDPLPIMGYDDVFSFVDEGVASKVAAASWTLNLDGSRGRLQLGGAPASSPEPLNEQASATVTSAAPLRVVVDGATADSFANALDAAVYSVGDRVTVTIRNPRPPLIQGVESA